VFFTFPVGLFGVRGNRPPLASFLERKVLVMTSMQLAQTQQDTVFSFSRVGDAAVVTLACPAVREWQSSVLTTYLADVVDRNRGRVVIVDVAGIVQFSCAWISTLLGLSERATSMGGQLVVVGLSRQSRRMLRTTGLLRRLKLAGSTQEAIAMTEDTELAPWRMAVAKMLAIPVSTASPRRRAA
jgi:anti-anti-sigma factor